MADNKIFDDGFWDLDKKYVKSKDIAIPSPYQKSSVSAVDITIDGDTPISAPIPLRKVPQRSSANTVYEYKPDNIFINKVRIISTDKDGEIFGISNMFMRERAAMLHKVGVECNYVSFYSYSPRYSQMTKAQLAYYLWWRENARRSNYIPTDISYIKLYMTELVTATGDEDVTDNLYRLCQVSKLCASNPVWFVYTGRIISDFCLLHGLACPTALINEIMSTLISEHICDEFFLPLNQSTRKNYADIALSYISVYNYKKSKFYENEKCEIFDKYIKEALNEVFNCDRSYNKIASLASGIFSTSLTDRKLFDGRPEFCTQGARIQISYYPISCISTIVTNAIRYTENKLRECLNIRTRLAINDMDSDVAQVIDEYFKKVAYKFVKEPKKTAPQKKVVVPKVEEYDKLYDSPAFTLSLDRAAEIEKESWETTYKLTEAFGGESTPSAEPQISAPSSTPEPIVQTVTEPQKTVCEPVSKPDDSQDSSLASAFGESYKFLLICKSGYSQNLKSFARDMGMTVDELADNINEIAVDVIGDIIIEECDGTYKIVPDYLDMIV